MLKTLSVWNFALLEHVQIEFSRGLNILTGETGAGKSILIDSLGVVLGRRTSVDNIRTGADWLRVEAVFETVGQPVIHNFLLQADILDEGELLIVSRQVTRSGRNAIQINGCHVTLQLLKQLSSLLIDIHGQHENQALLSSESQFALLESYFPPIKQQLDRYREQYDAWRKLQQELAVKKTASREYAQRLDMLRWQTNEISAAALSAGEDEKLETEIKVLTNAEKISGFVKESYQLLENGGRNNEGVLSALIKIKQNLESLGRYDDKMSGVLKMVDDASCQLQECSYELRDYGEDIDYSPGRLDKLQQRMDEIYKLRKKYGATIDDVLAHYEAAKQELSDIENYDELLGELQQKITAAEKDLSLVAAELTAMRTSAALKLSAAIQEHLLSLGMPKARFEIVVRGGKAFSAAGQDEISLLFSANLGEEAKLLQKVASGGELSRIALAVKAVTAARDPVDVMVFDEIDTGIGGKTAQMVAERIALVAAHKQVLCITHLPQIACMADAHLYIDKQARGDKTVTEVKRLSTSEQLNEIARMASGIDITAASLDNAMEMLDNARIKKERQRTALLSVAN
ncbi:MAG: DNA repair protein RecN [Selenomonadaceae bacterium]